MKVIYPKALLFFLVFTPTHSSFSQTIDSVKVVSDSAGAISVDNKGISWLAKKDSAASIGHFGGAISVTNNGISLIPTFSLGKPAIIFDMSAGKRRLSFEPQLRFGLDGKPCRAAGAVFPVLVAIQSIEYEQVTD